MNFKKEITKIVRNRMYRHALYNQYCGGLRFELSKVGNPLDRVLTALHKAAFICQDIFDKNNKILVHLQKYTTSNVYGLRTTLRELQTAGITIQSERNFWVEKATSDAEEADKVDGTDSKDTDKDAIYVAHIAFELPFSKLQNLLWCAFAVDFKALRPNPQCLVYLINVEKQIIVHPYDDRGMDVIGNKKLVLKIYQKHYNWLLNYNIKEMDEYFLK